MLTIQMESIATPDAQELLAALSGTLAGITGADGTARFSPDDVAGPGGVFAVARADGCAVGCGALRPRTRQIGEIKRMYAKNRGAGIGGAVLEFLEREAAALGYTALVLETRRCNTGAVAFYLSHGYGETAPYGPYRSMPEAICFQKVL